MGLEARKFDKMDFDEEQLDTLASNENGMDAGMIEKIQNIRVNLMEDISKAKIEGILNEKDALELEKEIQRHSADQKGISQVASKVRSVIDENKSLIDSFVKGLTSERDIDNKLIIDDHIQRFKALSTEEKKQYVKNLRKNLDWVETLYREVLKHSPEKAAEFRKMSGKEKKNYVEDLQKRSKNIEAYRKLIDTNREHFSKESEEEYMTQFKELKTVAEQERWIREFPKEVERKSEVTKKFKAFPQELQDKFPEFFEARRKQREVILQKMERALEEAHLDVLNNDPNAKHFSEKDRAEAMKWWKVSSTDIRIIMLKALPGHLKKTAELSKKYEGLSDVVRLDVQQKLGFDNFYNLSFDEKNKALEEAKKLEESGDKLTVQYEGKLREAMTKKYMGKATHDAFMKEFKDLSVDEKTDWIAKFETHELAKRKEVTERFQNEVSPQDQQKNAAFYEMGYHDRVKLVSKLLGIDEKDVAAEPDESEKSAEKAKSVEQFSAQAMSAEREGNNAATADLKKVKWGEALKLYQKLLKLDPQDDIAQGNYQRLAAKYAKAFPKETLPQDDDEGLDEYQISAALESAKQGSVMHEKMKRQTIASELADLTAKSELYNANTTDSRQKTKHLGSEFDRALQEELLDHTGGEMVLDKEGKARDIRKIDVKRMNKLEAQEVYDLKQEVVTHRGDKAQNVHHLQLNNRESGQIVTAKAAKDQVGKNKEQLQNELAERAAAALKARGKKLTAKDMAALREAAANDDLYVKLQNAA